MKRYLFTWLVCLATALCATAQQIEITEQGKPISIRGLSVVNDSVAWASGSGGNVALSTNGGKSWTWKKVQGFEKLDFRDIEAFSDHEAIIMSSGTPAVILKTIDAGETWAVCYRNDDKAYFLDAMDFAGKKHGFVMGDPIDGKFLLLETTNGGNHWAPVKDAPAAIQGEAAFAASGTCLRVTKGSIYIATGGTVARIITSPVKTLSWTYQHTNLIHGKDSQGTFSIALGNSNAVLTGGDYVASLKRDSAINVYDAKLKSFTLPQTSGSGYQSCVEYLNTNTFLSTGTPGTNISTDGGYNWKVIDKNSFNVCRKAKSGSLVILAGDKGKLAIFKN